MEHPISGLMETAMQSIKEMVDVNTIVGDAVEAKDGTITIPISKVSFGFAAGGSEFGGGINEKPKDSAQALFGGGSGAGVSIQPVAFMVVGQDQIKLMSVSQSNPLDKLIDYIPEAVAKIGNFINKKKKADDDVEITIDKK